MAPVLKLINLPYIISHRGNIEGPNKSWENHPEQIRFALKEKYSVEIDVWYVYNSWWLGHDEPQYQIDINFLLDISGMNREGVSWTIFPHVWIHCKNMEAVEQIQALNKASLRRREEEDYLTVGRYAGLNYFFHQEDSMTLTSRGYMWVHPKVKLVPVDSIWVVPFDKPFDFTDFNWGRVKGVCVDNPKLLRDELVKLRYDV